MSTTTSWRYGCPMCGGVTWSPNVRGDYYCQNCQDNFDEPVDKKTEPSDDARPDWVTPDQCAHWRRMRRARRDTDAIAAEADFTATTVHRHVHGRCGHDDGATAHVIPNVPASLCSEWRAEVASGRTRKGVAADCRYHYITVTRHVRGECSHGDPA